MSAISSAPAVVIDPHLPRTLRYPGGLRAFMAFWTVLFAAFAWAGGREPTESGKWAIWLIFGVLATLCGVVLVHTLVGGLTLETERIERFGLLGRRGLMRTDIAGFRLSSYTGWRVRPLSIVPNDPRLGRIGVFWGFRNDAVFKRWIVGYPDLGVDGPRAEPPPVVWTGSQTALKRVALGLNIVAGAAAAWVAFVPVPYGLSLAVAAFIPWFGVGAVRATYGAMTFGTPRHSTRPTAAFVILLPTAAVAMRPTLDIEILDWLDLAIPLALGAVAAVGGFQLLFRWMRNGLWWWVGPAVFGAAYAFGVFASANLLLDAAPAQAFRTEVVDKTVSHGRSTSYDLDLAPWGPRTRSDRVTVKYAVYEAVHIGGPVCIALHPGAFGVRWYAVAPCGTQSGAP